MSEFFSIIITKYLFTGVIKRKSYVFSMFSGFYCRLGDLFIVESNVKLDIMDTSTCITKLLTSKTGKRDRSAVASFFLFKDIPHTIETPSRLYFTALPPREEAFDTWIFGKPCH